jgi:hypothetical protein
VSIHENKIAVPISLNETSKSYEISCGKLYSTKKSHVFDNMYVNG